MGNNNDHFEKVKELIKKRNDVLRSLDINKAIAYCKEYDIPYPHDEFKLLYGLHLARLNCKGMTAAEREESRLWLEERGLIEKKGPGKNKS